MGSKNNFSIEAASFIDAGTVAQIAVLWFGLCKWFPRSFVGIVLTDKLKSTHEYLFEVNGPIFAINQKICLKCPFIVKTSQLIELCNKMVA